MTGIRQRESAQPRGLLPGKLIVWTTCVLGVIFVALGAWAAFDATSFAHVVANFGDYNAHLVHDFAACSTTFGTGLLIGWRVQPWRVPALTLAALWNGLHAISHILDVDAAQPAAVGPLEAGLLVAVTATLAACAIGEHRQSQRPKTTSPQ